MLKQLLFGTLIWMVIFFKRAQGCNGSLNLISAAAPGNITIGGLFDVHQQSERNSSILNTTSCSGFDVDKFLGVMSMIYTIQAINNSTEILPGIILGYEILDTCSDITTALADVFQLLSLSKAPEHQAEDLCDYTTYRPFVSAVVGPGYSDISVAVGRVFQLFMMPQISYSSSSTILSDKAQFPSFLRTVPSEADQIKAMTLLMVQMNWRHILIIGSDDDYSQQGVTALVTSAQQANICIDFSQTIPTSEITNLLPGLIQKVRESPANVVVVFAEATFAKVLLQRAINDSVKKTWLASDTWSVSSFITTLPNIDTIGNILGFSFKMDQVNGFADFLDNLPSSQWSRNQFYEEYQSLRAVCNSSSISEIINCISSKKADSVTRKFLGPDGFLKELIEAGTPIPFNVFLSVLSVAHALHDLLGCDITSCNGSLEFTPWMLLEKLKTVRFTVENQGINFTLDTDQPIEFDLVFWESRNNGIKVQVIGNYTKQKNFTIQDNYKMVLQNISSSCSSQCKPGEMKSSNSCCYMCVPCPEGLISNITDAASCFPCQQDEYPNNTVCIKMPQTYFNWTDNFAIFLMIFDILGIIIVGAIAMIFTIHYTTPVVKAAGSFMVYVILTCLLLSFISVIFFIGKPTDIKCKIRQIMFAISFTCCISCMLMNSFRIFVAFMFDPLQQHILKIVYKPFMIIPVFILLEVLILVLWMTLNGPTTYLQTSEDNQVYRCSEGSLVAYYFTHGYTTFISLICFTFAFVSRKLPHNYNEAKFITFAMLVHLIAWMIFFAEFSYSFGIYLSAIQALTCLISSYGVVIWYFLPKCYIMLFRKEKNTRENFSLHVYSYSQKTVNETFQKAHETTNPPENRV
ncbi:G-protein coupled receptor family C group 6 member A-like [Erpetoichthys calabaricus]|uniref:G-protein coupled receptor family C group 6 member A-like n=1 Tax=Erpetoichthys calabaricus TaxID=27687 RepID=UPI002234BCAE|nr:G-protein coupled receptor family C group 6 member A-like [Erpetoichthys calabaricus]